MGTDYEQYYRDAKHALGEPSARFVNFFNAYAQNDARVLDVGCGQGRDALMIARLGHSVVGVDISPRGIADMVADARAESLPVTGIVADIRSWQADGTFDVILIDRTLHMLTAPERHAVTQTLVTSLGKNGYVLISDEVGNIDGILAVLQQDGRQWHTILHNKGWLFLQQKDGAPN